MSAHNEPMTEESPQQQPGQTNASRTRELNDTIRYTMWSVFRLERTFGADDAARAAEVDEVTTLIEALGTEDVVVRGVYDVSGLRADADLMVWSVALELEALQDYAVRLARTPLGRHLGAFHRAWSGP